ncbi:MAG: tetratricopeptide repeat protein, partial [Acidobacteria bacterium]|nr:tetratricopeptide repeat protein [Acidobacteriota bacterium]
QEFAEAEPLLLRALAIREKTFGAAHEQVAFTLERLAEIYRAQNKLEKAEPVYRRLLVTQENIYGPNHPTVAVTLENLIEMYRAPGDAARLQATRDRLRALRAQLAARKP